MPKRKADFGDDRPSKKAKRFGGSLGSQIATKAYVNRVVKRSVETKYYDVTQSDSPSTTPTITQINTVSQGDGADNRDGNVIFGTSLMLRGNVAVADTTNIVRVIVFVDKNSNGSAPTASNILQVSTDPKSPINIVNRHRFHVLRDMQFSLSTYGPGALNFKEYVKLGRLRMDFNGSDTTARMNGLYILTMSDSGSVSHPPCKWYSRLRFTD